MKSVLHEDEDISNTQLPLSIYDSVVRTLFKNQGSMAIGLATMVIAPLILFVKTHDYSQIIFAILFFFFGLVRLSVAHRFSHRAKGHFSRDELELWEKRYGIAGSLYVGAGGLWVVYGFAYSQDQFVHLLSISLLLCYLVGIIGRNFSSDKVVWQQVVAAAAPIMFALTFFGTTYHALLGLFLFPFFLAIWSMSGKLRAMLFGAVISEREQRIIAARFNVALKHIAHGVAMFDTGGKIVVANERFGSLLNINESGLVGKNLGEFAPITNTSVEGECLIDNIKRALDRSKSNRFSFTLDKRTLEIDFYPMPKGGVVFVRDITDQVASEEAIRKLASFDPLTNLPNRRSFTQHMQGLLDNKGNLIPLAMFFIDLDKFKEVNDSLGHAVGDEMLVIVAKRLQALIPSSGLICRFGGDEFVVVIPGMTDAVDCAGFADKISAEISKPLDIEGKEIRNGATIGISLCPENGMDTDQLLKTSDAALYAAKSVVRGSYSFYSDSLGSHIEERRQLETDLRAALEREDLRLHFQPLVNVHSRRVSTCEALLRWEHKTKGNISPAIFIPIAEEIGLITKLSAFVLREACTACLSWPQNIAVAVNISSIQFQQSDVFQSVQEALEATGLDPKRLEIEVTESAMLGSVETTTETLNKLKELGVRISLDDFGTGFSSLSYLHSLPLDKVKIDRSFITTVVDDERSLTLLSGVTELTHNLGLKIVVEGIESEEQMLLLCEKIRVDEMQGYLFGRAMPNADIVALLGGQVPLRDFGNPLKTVA